MSDGGQLKNILILDDDADFRKLLTTILGKLFEGTGVDEYDPVARGIPGNDFNWGKYDVLLLDYHLTIMGITGLDILQNNRKNKLFPATVMLTGAGNEEVAVRAIKAGVYDYLRKESLEKDKLQAAILDAFEKHKVEREKLNELTSQSHAFNKSLFYQELEQKEKDKHKRVLIFIELDNHEMLEDQLGLILRDNIIRHIAKQSFDIFKQAGSNPSITRFGDSSVALLIDEPDARSTLEFNLGGICAHLGKHPYVYDGKKVQTTISLGALCLSDKQLNAEEYIRHARHAVHKAAAEDGNSYYLYETSDWDTLKGKPVVVETKADELDFTSTAQPETAAEPAARPEAKPVAPPPEPAPETRQAAPGEQGAEPEPEPEPDTAPEEEAKPDARPIAELLQEVKAAFDDKRATQTFQSVISLTNEEDAGTYILGVRLINKDGTLMEEDLVKNVEDVPAFKKFIDRWMLREIIGRIVSRKDEKYTFFMKMNDESIADATFFNWVRKMLTELGKASPGRQIALEISADELQRVQKQAGAIMSYLKKSHGFRFILGQCHDAQSLQDMSNALQFDLIRTNIETITALSETYPDTGQDAESEEKLSLLQQLKGKGIQFIADDVEDATKLTEIISLGADYASGMFIGEPTDQLDDLANVESYEIV